MLAIKKLNQFVCIELLGACHGPRDRGNRTRVGVFESLGKVGKRIVRQHAREDFHIGHGFIFVGVAERLDNFGDSRRAHSREPGHGLLDFRLRRIARSLDLRNQPFRFETAQDAH